MSDFINQLREGNQELLTAAITDMPKLFKSYRFIDYLLSEIPHEGICLQLQSHRNTCTLPFWREVKDKGLTVRDSLVPYFKKYVNGHYEKKV